MTYHVLDLGCRSTLRSAGVVIALDLVQLVGSSREHRDDRVGGGSACRDVQALGLRRKVLEEDVFAALVVLARVQAARVDSNSVRIVRGGSVIDKRERRDGERVLGAVTSVLLDRQLKRSRILFEKATSTDSMHQSPNSTARRANSAKGVPPSSRKKKGLGERGEERDREKRRAQRSKIPYRASSIDDNVVGNECRDVKLN